MVRRLASASLALFLLFSFASNGAGASTRGKLNWAENRLEELSADIHQERAELRSVKQAIWAGQSQLRALQRELNELANRIGEAADAFQATRDEVQQTKEELAEARRLYRDTRARIDERARQMFMQGPGSGLEFILGATSLSDLTDRVEFVNAVEIADSNLANDVQNLANELEAEKEKLVELKLRQQAQLAELRERQAELSDKFDEQAGIVADLDAKRAEQEGILADLAERAEKIRGLVDRFEKKLATEEAAAAARAAANATGVGGGGGGDGPLYTCPVGNPHAVGDDFGAPRYAGGYHTHQGNDIFAPEGTPIYAPFSGTAVNSANTLGGNAVTVYGSAGYVYNAHLSRYGTLGQVSTGTVIGYVGNTGDAQGTSPHDHFEWHPGNGSAVDPHPYLMEVC